MRSNASKLASFQQDRRQSVAGFQFVNTSRAPERMNEAVTATSGEVICSRQCDAHEENSNG